MVNVFFEETEILEFTPEFFISWLDKLCRHHGQVLGEVNLIFTNDEYLLEVNKEHLDHDYYTDIITFNYNENDISGDLYVSVDRVRENSLTLNVPFLDELYRVVAHGVLHLIGFNDKTDKEEFEMRKEENIALEMIVSRET